MSRQKPEWKKEREKEQHKGDLPPRIAEMMEQMKRLKGAELEGDVMRAQRDDTSKHTPNIFDFLEPLCDRIDAYGNHDRAQCLRASFARSTGGVDLPFLVDALSAPEVDAVAPPRMDGSLVQRLRWRIEALREALTHIKEIYDGLIASSALSVDDANARLCVASGAKVETAWLIEINSASGPEYFQLQHDADWTKDHNKALRFARREDADHGIAHFGWTEARAVEHMWLPGKAFR